MAPQHSKSAGALGALSSASPSPPAKQVGFSVRHEVQALAGPVACSSTVSALPSPTQLDAGRDPARSRWEDGCYSHNGRQTGLAALARICNAGRLGPVPSQEFAAEQHGRVEVVGTVHFSDAVRRLAKAVVLGLKAQQQPFAAAEGMGGTYLFLNEAGHRVAIVKPCDEEPFAPNNPKGYVGRRLGDPGVKPTVRVGEAAMREVAAYLLDAAYGHFCRVPPTVLVKVSHPTFCNKFEPMPSAAWGAAPTPTGGLRNGFSQELSLRRSVSGELAAPPGRLVSKLASMQEFVQHDMDANEIGPSSFSVADVHRIGILDIRLMNMDRHGGNILVRRSSAAHLVSSSLSVQERLSGVRIELVPIDHGFCLPEALEAPFFEWLYWGQAMIPFDEAELAYIAGLNAAADVEMLRSELPSLHEGCLRMLELGTLLLQMCAEARLTLAEIGAVLSRPLAGLDEEASEFERTCAAARADIVDRGVTSSSEERGISDDEGDSRGGSSESGSSSSSEDGGGRIWHTTGVSPFSAASQEPSGSVDAGEVIAPISFQRPCWRGATGPPAPGGSGAVGSSERGAGALFDLDENTPSPVPPVGSAGCRASSLGALRTHIGRREPAPEQAWGTLAGGTARPWLAGCSSTPPRPAARAPDQAPDALLASASVRPRHGMHRVRRRRARGRRRPRPVAYPPPVEGASPDSVSTLFADLGEAQWRAFVAALRRRIAAALKANAWRQRDAPHGAAKFPPNMSCPRF